MWQIIGWIIWGILVFFAISWVGGCRTYAKSGQALARATIVQTFFLWIIAILFLVFNWNKLHILWVTPIAFFIASFLVIGRIPILSSLLLVKGIPILSPLVLFATRIFLSIILFGVKKPNS